MLNESFIKDHLHAMHSPKLGLKECFFLQHPNVFVKEAVILK